LVIPAELRQRKHWTEGTTLVAVETAHGVILTGRSELEDIVRRQLAGKDVVAELIEERREAAAREDRA
jgi:bifunctional DNA-binding transcriptional regulator/antitoxin component of YhaV-PrlF toxin-antitoxin module